MRSGVHVSPAVAPPIDGLAPAAVGAGADLPAAGAGRVRTAPGPTFRASTAGRVRCPATRIRCDAPRMRRATRCPVNGVGVTFLCRVEAKPTPRVFLWRNRKIHGTPVHTAPVQVGKKRHAPLAPRAGTKALADQRGDRRPLTRKKAADLPQGHVKTKAYLVVGLHETEFIVRRLGGSSTPLLGIFSSIGYFRPMRIVTAPPARYQYLFRPPRSGSVPARPVP